MKILLKLTIVFFVRVALIKLLTKNIDVITIFPEGIISNDFKSFTYDEFFEQKINTKIKHVKKNYEIIDNDDLNLLKITDKKIQLAL